MTVFSPRSSADGYDATQIGIVNALTNLVNTRWEGDWWTAIFAYSMLIPQTIGGCRLSMTGRTGADLIVMSLLSLGLWGAIWAVVASLASTMCVVTRSPCGNPAASHSL